MKKKTLNLRNRQKWLKIGFAYRLKEPAFGFPSKRRFYSKDDHHCLNVMLMYELQKTETKPKTTIIQYFIALNYIINYYKTATNKPSLN